MKLKHDHAQAFWWSRYWSNNRAFLHLTFLYGRTGFLVFKFGTNFFDGYPAPFKWR